MFLFFKILLITEFLHMCTSDETTTYSENEILINSIEETSLAEDALLDTVCIIWENIILVL